MMRKIRVTPVAITSASARALPKMNEVAGEGRAKGRGAVLRARPHRYSFASLDSSVEYDAETVGVAFN